MHDVTSNSVTDQANTETSLGQGIDTDDTMDDSLDNDDSLAHEVCCTLQVYGDRLDVDHVAEGVRAVDDGGFFVVSVRSGVDVDVDVDADADDSDTVEMDDRDAEDGNGNEEGDDDGDRSLCCRCIV